MNGTIWALFIGYPLMWAIILAALAFCAAMAIREGKEHDGDR